MSIAIAVAVIAAGLFAGASAYVSFVEHPARIECGGAVGIRHFASSAPRAAVMQGGLAVLGLVAAVVAWAQGAGAGWLAGGLLLGAMVPFTFVVIVPINRRLLAPGFDTGSAQAMELLRRWGRLHAVRTAAGVVAFLLFARLGLP